MKHNILTLLAFFLFVIAVGCIWLTAGAVDQETMGFGQALIRCGIGLVLLAVDVLLVNYLGKEGSYAERNSMSGPETGRNYKRMPDAGSSQGCKYREHQ